MSQSQLEKVFGTLKRNCGYERVCYQGFCTEQDGDAIQALTA